MRLISVIIFLGFSFKSISQITVPPAQKALYGVVEATWCGYCGQYGQPYTKAIINNTANKGNYVVLHRSATSDLYSLTAKDMVVSFGISGQPVFTVNGISYGAYSGTTVSTISNEINNFYSASAADVNTGFNSTIWGDTLYIESKTKFFNALNGNYQMAIYVIEDSIWGAQADYSIATDTSIWHNHVLRTSMNGSFGVSVGTGAISAGSEVLLDYQLTLDPSWDKTQLSIITVIWEEVAGNFTAVNSNSTGGELVLSSPELVLKSKSEIYPNPNQGQFTVSLEKKSHLKLFNLLGELVLTTELNEGNNQLNLDILPGLYVANFSNESHSWSEKIEIKK